MVFIREENIPKIESRKVINERGVLIAKTWCGFSIIYLALPMEFRETGGEMREEKPRLLGLGYRSKKAVFLGIVFLNFPITQIFNLIFFLYGLGEALYKNNPGGFIPFVFSLFVKLTAVFWAENVPMWIEEFKYRIRKG